ncbi:MAG: hypothetical protein V9E88_09640 [Ferruginibacter sp.]
MNFQTMSKQRKFILIASAIGVISMFLPWVKISLFGFSSSVNGMRDSGIFIFLCFVACGVISFLGNQSINLDRTMWMVTLIVGGLAALIMIINFLRASDARDFLSYGFYLALLSSIGLVVAAYLFRTPGESIKSGFDSLKKDIEEKTKQDTPK